MALRLSDHGDQNLTRLQFVWLPSNTVPEQTYRSSLTQIIYKTGSKYVFCYIYLRCAIFSLCVLVELIEGCQEASHLQYRCCVTLSSKGIAQCVWTQTALVVSERILVSSFMNNPLSHGLWTLVSCFTYTW